LDVFGHGNGIPFKTEANESNEGKKQEDLCFEEGLGDRVIILVASSGFLVLYSATRDAKASNWLFDRSVLLLRLAGFRSVAV
jgi:hypothetical protein